MRKTRIKERPFSASLYLDEREYEFLRRRAVYEGHNSFQQSIKSRIFPPKWVSQLRHLQEEQKKLGFKDSNFYHPQVLRRMGLKVERGRKLKWSNLPKD